MKHFTILDKHSHDDANVGTVSAQNKDEFLKKLKTACIAHFDADEVKVELTDHEYGYYEDGYPRDLDIIVISQDSDENGYTYNLEISKTFIY